MAKSKDEAGENTEASTDEAPEKIKIQHHRSPHFSSHFASGAILSGPTADGMYHITFHADAMGIKTETGTLIGDVVKEGSAEVAHYKTSIEQDDLEPFREDKARVTLSYRSLLSLRDLLNRQHPPETETKKDEKDGDSNAST